MDSLINEFVDKGISNVFALVQVEEAAPAVELHQVEEAAPAVELHQVEEAAPAVELHQVEEAARQPTPKIPREWWRAAPPVKAYWIDRAIAECRYLPREASRVDVDRFLADYSKVSYGADPQARDDFQRAWWEKWRKDYRRALLVTRQEARKNLTSQSIVDSKLSGGFLDSKK